MTSNTFHADTLRRWLPAAAIALLALVLRLLNIRHGLPDFVEEAIPFKQAFEMWGWDTGRADLNPHFFNYPSFSIYLHFFVQKCHYLVGYLAGQFSSPADYWLQYNIDPTVHVVCARLVGVLSDVATTLAAFALGERLRRGSGFLAAALVALSPTIIETGHSVFSDSVMAALGLWALERLIAWLHDGGRRRLVTAVILIGLATGAKYTAGLLVVPLAWVIWRRHGRQALYLWPLAAAGCVLVFLLSSPFVLFDFGTFWHDFNFERDHMAEGHLGTLGRHGGLFQMRTVADNLGWPACLFLLLSLVLLPLGKSGRRWPSVLTLWLFLLPAIVSVATFRMEAARYLLPILPVAAVLAAAGALAIVGRWQGRRRHIAVAVLGLVLVGPVLRPGILASQVGADTTQLQARRWLEEHLGPDDITVLESWGPALNTRFSVSQVEWAPAFPLAGEELRSRFRARPVYRGISLPMVVSGNLEVQAVPRGGRPVTLTVFEHQSELNQALYEPALFLGVDYMVVTGAVRGRYEADRARYPVQNRFYALLDREAEKVADFRPSLRVAGPTISIYRLDPATRAVFQQVAGPLDLLWWAESVPQSFRLRLEELAVPPEKRSGGASSLATGETAAWVRSLRQPFDRYIRSYLFPMAQNFVDVHRYAHGRQFAAAILKMEPDNLNAVLLFSYCAVGQRRWTDARRIVAEALETVRRESPASIQLRLEYVRILENAGESELVIEQADRILEAVPAESSQARQARAFKRRAVPSTGSEQ